MKPGQDFYQARKLLNTPAHWLFWPVGGEPKTMTYDEWRLASPPYCEEPDEPDPIQEREDYLADEADRQKDER